MNGPTAERSGVTSIRCRRGSGFGGTVAVLGADGLIYLIGGISPVSGVTSAATFVFDPQLQVWFAGPALNTALPQDTPHHSTAMIGKQPRFVCKV